MSTNNKNYNIMNLGSLSKISEQGRIMIGETLGLTGCEISLNSLPANQSIPFVHSHKQNEEVYIVLKGSGIFMIDTDEFPIEEGSLIRIDPAGERVLKANNEELTYICIQVKKDSLQQATELDGVMHKTKASWM